MSEDSPHFWFSPDSRGSLFRKVFHQEFISRAEINKVLEADAAAETDLRMMPILVAVCTGRLAIKKGRPSHTDSLAYKGRIFWATELVADRTLQIREERKGMSALERRGLQIPSEQAAEEIAREYNMPESGRGLLKAIYSLKDDPLFGDGKSVAK